MVFGGVGGGGEIYTVTLRAPCIIIVIISFWYEPVERRRVSGRRRRRRVPDTEWRSCGTTDVGCTPVPCWTAWCERLRWDDARTRRRPSWTASHAACCRPVPGQRRPPRRTSPAAGGSWTPSISATSAKTVSADQMQNQPVFRRFVSKRVNLENCFVWWKTSNS